MPQNLLPRVGSHPPPQPTLPVPNPTRSFWLNSSPDANPLAKHGSTGPLSTDDADVVIIGSGITGVSAAYHLAKANAGLKVVILEARDFCSGATGRNGGQMNALPIASFASRALMHGVRDAVRAADLETHTVRSVLEFLADAGLENAVDLVKLMQMDLIYGEKEWKDRREDWRQAQEAGVEMGQVDWLSIEEMSKEYGVLHRASRFLGFNLWPLKLVTHLYEAASQSNNLMLSLHTHTPVTSIDTFTATNTEHASAQRLPRRQVVHTGRGDIVCTSVLHATNAYAGYLIPHLHGREGIIPRRGQVIVQRAEKAGVCTQHQWTANEGYEYWFPRHPSHGKPLVVLGGGREVSKSDPPGEDFITDDSTTNLDVGAKLRTFLEEVFPGIGKAEVEWEWTGIMAFTETHDPLVGPVMSPKHNWSEDCRDQYEGQFFAGGYSGFGMPRAYGCAEVLAGMIVHELRWLRVGGEMVPRWGKDRWDEEKLPEWFPRCYLTWNNINTSKIL